MWVMTGGGAAGATGLSEITFAAPGLGAAGARGGAAFAFAGDILGGGAGRGSASFRFAATARGSTAMLEMLSDDAAEILYTAEIEPWVRSDRSA
jgi:hypothetical protein